jgi:hypothetical protein
MTDKEQVVNVVQIPFNDFVKEIREATDVGARTIAEHVARDAADKQANRTAYLDTVGKALVAFFEPIGKSVGAATAEWVAKKAGFVPTPTSVPVSPAVAPACMFNDDELDEFTEALFDVIHAASLDTRTKILAAVTPEVLVGLLDLPRHELPGAVFQGASIAQVERLSAAVHAAHAKPSPTP